METDKKRTEYPLVGLGLAEELLAKVLKVFPACYIINYADNLTPMVELCRSLGDALLIVPIDLVKHLHIGSLAALAVGDRVRVLALAPQSSATACDLAIRQNCAGVLNSDASEQMYERAAQAICHGELWYPRAVLSRLAWGQMTHAARPRLTKRESEILQLVGADHKNQSIADQLFISRETVRWHLRLLYSKIGVAGRLQARQYALRLALA